MGIDDDEFTNLRDKDDIPGPSSRPRAPNFRRPRAQVRVMTVQKTASAPSRRFLERRRKSFLLDGALRSRFLLRWSVLVDDAGGRGRVSLHLRGDASSFFFFSGGSTFSCWTGSPQAREVVVEHGHDAAAAAGALSAAFGSSFFEPPRVPRKPRTQ